MPCMGIIILAASAISNTGKFLLSSECRKYEDILDNHLRLQMGNAHLATNRKFIIFKLIHDVIKSGKEFKDFQL